MTALHQFWENQSYLWLPEVQKCRPMGPSRPVHGLVGAVWTYLVPQVKVFGLIKT